MRTSVQIKKISLVLFLVTVMLFGSCGRKEVPLKEELLPTLPSKQDVELTQALISDMASDMEMISGSTMVPSSTEIPELMPTLSPAPTSSPLPTTSLTPAPSPSPASTPRPTLTADPTSTPSPMPTASPTSTPSPAPTASPTPRPTLTPTPSPTPIVMEGIGFEELSDKDNYVYGYYKHWGGEFAEAQDAVCATEFIPVAEEFYYYYTNDPRVVVTIQQYDKDRKWIIPKEEYRKLKCGTKVVLEENTEYLSVTLRSSTWGVDVKELFECGLAVGFVRSEPTLGVDTVKLTSGVLGGSSSWKRGIYEETSGNLLLGKSGVSFGAYCEIESEKYIASLPDKKMELRVIELTQDNRVIRLKKLINSELWIPDKNTKKAAITLVSTSKETTVQQLEKTVEQFGSELLGVYSDENYNKEMQMLTATEFVQKMNVGWNLGNSLDCKVKTRGLDANVKQELTWFNPYVEKSLIDYVASMGFNTIRIPVTWYYNTEVDENGTVVIGEAFLARVKQVVNYAIENDLYVILNSHHDEEMIYAGVDDTEMEQVCKDAEALWKQIAYYFRDYDEHLIFESYNEVDNRELSWTFGEKAAEQVNRLNQVFVTTVRSTGGNNANRILMVPTLIDKYNEQMLQAFAVPEDTVEDRLIVQVHAYSKVFSQAIDHDFSLMEEYSDRWGVPIVIGEFGTTEKYFEPSLRAAHAVNYIARAAEHGIKCIWWDNGGDFSIINRTDYSKSDTGLINALFLGLEGIKCELENEIVLNQPEEYTDGNVQDKEIVVNRYWGAIATDKGGDAISLPEGSKCMLSLTAQGETSEVWMVGVAFYDKNGEVVPVTTNGVSRTTTTIKGLFWTCDLPEEACYIRVSMHSPFTSISRKVFDQSLKDGELELSITVFDLEDVYGKLIPVYSLQ